MLSKLKLPENKIEKDELKEIFEFTINGNILEIKEKNDDY